MGYKERGKLLKAASDNGFETVEQLIAWAMAEYKTEYLAARELGVYPNSIRHARTKPKDPRPAARVRRESE